MITDIEHGLQSTVEYQDRLIYLTGKYRPPLCETSCDVFQRPALEYRRDDLNGEQKQNDILVAAGYKMVKKNKEKRKLKFMDITAARDFLFHLKRLHHLWNRSQGRHDDTPAVQVIDKTLFS